MTANPSVRKWGQRIGVATAAGVVVAAIAAGVFWKELNATLAANRLASARDEASRTELAAKLVAMDAPAIPHVIKAFRSEDAEGCFALTTALQNRLQEVPATDPRFGNWCRPLLEQFSQFSTAGQEATLELVPQILTCPEPDFLQLCRDLVKSCYTQSSPEIRVRAVRLAMRPDLELKSTLVPLLSDDNAVVRRAAMIAVGPTDGSTTIIGDEELFRWLNDADWEVRTLCEGALASRGLEPEQIACGRKLTSPDASDRLQLLVDLKKARDSIRDPGPWLERLSRDPDPAIRAGAARVACECRLAFTAWLDRMATTDSDPTVRQIAAYYRAKAAEVRPAGFDDQR